MPDAVIWLDEWALELEGDGFPWHAKRARRRLSHREHGTEEYLVSGADTSNLAKRVDLSSLSM